MLIDLSELTLKLYIKLVAFRFRLFVNEVKFSYPEKTFFFPGAFT